LPQWYLVKLELAPSIDFPRGSPSRAYLLRLPLTAAGEIDNAALTASPKAAFVRRYWPDQPDCSGLVRANALGWTLDYGDGSGALRGHLDPARIEPGGLVQIVGLDGVRRPFRVMSARSD
jgi:hypothetical protein